VPGAVRGALGEFGEAAEGEGEGVDAFALAARLVHRVVGVHPFLDGNGRVARMVGCAVLMRYAGVVMTLGGEGEGDEEFLGVVVRGSEWEGMEEEERAGRAWAEMSSLLLRRGGREREERGERGIERGELKDRN